MKHCIEKTAQTKDSRTWKQNYDLMKLIDSQYELEIGSNDADLEGHDLEGHGTL